MAGLSAFMATVRENESQGHGGYGADTGNFHYGA